MDELSMTIFGCPYNDLGAKEKAILHQRVPVIAQNSTIQVVCADGNQPSVLGVYAHGQLEDGLGFDLVQLPGWNGETGIFHCEWEGLDCTLYVWSREAVSSASGKDYMFYRGLVVLDDDEAAIAFAQGCYTKKPTTI